MQDVPKIVLKRLQETQAAGIHPDADLLTAFTEQSLTESERARVMEHLARCSDCREVVAFALPATEAVAIPTSSRTRAGWLTWPLLRWSVAVAGIIAITSIGIVQYRQRQKSDTLVSSLTQPNETAATAEQALPPSPPASELQGIPPQTEKEKQAQLQSKALPSRADNFAADRLVRPLNPTLPAARVMHGAPSSVAGGGVRFGAAGGAAPKAAVSSPGDTLIVAGDSKNATPEGAAKPAPSSSARQMVEVPSSSQTLEVVQSEAAPATGTAPNQASDQLVEKQKDQTLLYQYSIKSDVSKAKNRATSQAASSGASAPEPAPPNIAPQTAPAEMQRTTPLWGINSTGALQRSFDAGKTWADVNVNWEPVSNGSNRAITAESTYGHENKKRKIDAQPSPVFRAVSAQGTEVWAGGSSATLYHSTDSGAHWARVLPSSSGATLTGDITSLEFFDSQHGRIATSVGEVWITFDDGQTWHRE